jgi:hypothetical protein
MSYHSRAIGVYTLRLRLASTTKGRSRDGLAPAGVLRRYVNEIC